MKGDQNKFWTGERKKEKNKIRVGKKTEETEEHKINSRGINIGIGMAVDPQIRRKVEGKMKNRISLGSFIVGLKRGRTDRQDIHT